MTIQFTDGERERLYAKIAMIGASGSGKTVSALKLAFGITGDWSKIGVADTENKRALAYVGTTHTGLQIGKFKHAPMYAPFKTENFEQAIDLAIKLGLEVLIFDSFSHEWEGLGGVTHAAEEAGGDFWNWKGPKIAHRRLVDKIQQSPIHIIVTIRTKQEYAVIPGGGKNGKNAIEKLGMKPVQSNDLDYEFLIAFHVNEDNEAVAKKDNTGLFRHEEFRIEADHGQKLKDWLIDGKEVKTVAEEAKEKENRRKEILKAFADASASNDKVKAYFTQLEVKRQRPIDQFPDSVLEQLYAKMNAPKEPPVLDTTPPPKEEKGTVKYESTINKYLKKYPQLEQLKNDFITKHQAEDIYSLNDERRKLLVDLLKFKADAIEKEKSA